MDSEFLDGSQYQTASILRYEKVYGTDFVSPGGRRFTVEMCRRLQLPGGARVLDVGCGLGGSAFVMARDFGWRVDGIDLSQNMLELARQKLAAHGLRGEVSLEWGDCLELEAEARYDVVYSRDVFLHIHDKCRLFEVLLASLKPGGRLLFTDYCCGPRPWSDEFRAYVENRGYDLHTVEQYRELIAAAGFEQVSGENISIRFKEILQADIERIERLDLDAGEREDLSQSWRQKLARCEAGHHRWGLFNARKGNN